MINISKIYRIGDVNMPSRMDRYDSENTDIGSRTNKNQQLYKELYSNKTYTEFTDNVKDNIVDLTNESNKNSNKRSDFRKTRLYYGNDSIDNKNSIKQINNIYKDILNNDVENKNYNINDIIEDAKKNRKEDNEEEKQKKIKSAEYSILNDLSKEKLKQYRDNKQKGITKEEEENLEELINTITSNSLRKRIDDELLSDLLPEDDLEKTSTKLLEELAEGIPDEIDDDTQNEIETTADLEKGLDRSFFTRSMDLKREDLILKNDEEELDDSFTDKTSIVKKVLIILVIIGILVIAGYFIYNGIK